MTDPKTKRTPQTNERVKALVNVVRIDLTEDKPNVAGRLFPALFLAVLFGLLLVALVTGVRTYSSVAMAQSTNNASREGLELIANSIRANDTTGCIAVGQGPEGRSLVVVEKLDSGTYEVRTYLYQGKVVQEYALAGNQYTPQSATELATSNSFDFTYANGLLSISTDQGSCEVALRNLQGGE
ncbi:DUF4860 domain-containing protein [Paratractidigestivibacter sp.]|uniref:DUF4860 domain-containing protein n=1 Tax=Paratractidigestivibacter sp. TaxID=2847316 RepID=UPI002AC9CAB0|nr:DUF4860 domain-containing protein [Paratractidigestivibacter sp.]